ncbi:MAG: DNA methylase [bacterium]|nr:DNA methylase [bacterium]
MPQEDPHSQERLTELESMIEANLQNFYDIGAALKEIRDARLYLQDGFNRFNDYIRTRWEIGKSQAYRLIEASSVIDNLSPIGDRLPEREAQVRPLTKLDPIDQRKVWRDFLNSGMPLKAANIQKFISNDMGRGNDRTSSSRIKIISKDYKAAVDALMCQIRISQSDRWKSTSREAALYWNRVMKDKIVRKT